MVVESRDPCTVMENNGNCLEHNTFCPDKGLTMVLTLNICYSCPKKVWISCFLTMHLNIFGIFSPCLYVVLFLTEREESRNQNSESQRESDCLLSKFDFLFYATFT